VAVRRVLTSHWPFRSAQDDPAGWWDALERHHAMKARRKGGADAPARSAAALAHSRMVLDAGVKTQRPRGGGAWHDKPCAYLPALPRCFASSFLLAGRFFFRPVGFVLLGRTIPA